MRMRPLRSSARVASLPSRVLAAALLWSSPAAAVLRGGAIVGEVLSRNGLVFDSGFAPSAPVGLTLAINPLIYAEVSIRFERIEERYRRRRGGQRSRLPDFYVGAGVAVAGLALLTRDPTRYRTYFPSLEIISP